MLSPLKAIAVPGAREFGRPPDWNSSEHGVECISLPVIVDEYGIHYSWWRFTWRQRLMVLLGRPLRLAVFGHQPAVAVELTQEAGR